MTTDTTSNTTTLPAIIPDRSYWTVTPTAAADLTWLADRIAYWENVDPCPAPGIMDAVNDLDARGFAFVFVVDDRNSWPGGLWDTELRRLVARGFDAMPTICGECGATLAPGDGANDYHDVLGESQDYVTRLLCGPCAADVLGVLVPGVNDQIEEDA